MSPLLLLVSMLCLWGVSCDAFQCTVTNPEGTDVTDELFVNNDPDFAVEGADGYVLCQGSYACSNFTMTGCPVIRCDGKEACYLAKLLQVTHAVECITTHSCHRSEITFEEPASAAAAAAGEEETVLEQKINCIGEGACDVAQITAPHAYLECKGRKACRKVDVQVDTVHCTHGDEYYEACCGYAGLQANCVLCGWRGCNDHVNVCRYKVEDEDKWVPCIPGQATGETCTGHQTQSVEYEMESGGDILN